MGKGRELCTEAPGVCQCQCLAPGPAQAQWSRTPLLLAGVSGSSREAEQKPAISSALPVGCLNETAPGVSAPRGYGPHRAALPTRSLQRLPCSVPRRLSVGRKIPLEPAPLFGGCRGRTLGPAFSLSLGPLLPCAVASLAPVFLPSVPRYAPGLPWKTAGLLKRVQPWAPKPACLLIPQSQSSRTVSMLEKQSEGVGALSWCRHSWHWPQWRRQCTCWQPLG